MAATLALRLHRTCAVLYLVSVALQVYMAGLALFGVASFMSHAVFGYLMILGGLVLLILTVAARLGRVAIGLAALVVILTLVQPVLALALRGSVPWLAALHPVNALAIFALAWRVGRSTAVPVGGSR